MSLQFTTIDLANLVLPTRPARPAPARSIHKNENIVISALPRLTPFVHHDSIQSPHHSVFTKPVSSPLETVAGADVTPTLRSHTPPLISAGTRTVSGKSRLFATLRTLKYKMTFSSHIMLRAYQQETECGSH